PEPRVALGRLASRFASAALDVSDGLAQDLGHLCTASRVKATVELERLPMTAAVRKALGPQGALAGGEDYELLMAVPPGRSRAFERACARAGQPVTRIGLISEGSGWVCRDAAGRVLPPPQGFDHFRQPDAGLTLPNSKAKPVTLLSP
ncbi:thiamine-phosphate kinase, partial [Pyxidicoccus sp. 3LFB2]